MLTRVFCWLTSGLLAFSPGALGAPSPSGARALVGSSASFFQSALCRHLGCVSQGVHRTRLEGSGNPVGVYGYGLRAGGQVEVTRYNLKGQSGDARIYSLLFTQKASQNLTRTASTAAQLATVAAGYTVTAPQIAACWKAVTDTKSSASRLIAARGFDAPGVHCAVREGQAQVLVILTN